MAKNKQQTKTTKHTIEFSNNTPCWMVRPKGNPASLLQLIGDVNAGSRARCLRGSWLVAYCTRSISAPRATRFSTNSG
jgi:hypothetical protein